MRKFHMFQYFEAKDSIKLKKEIKTAVKILTKQSVHSCVIDILRKELKCLTMMTPDIENGVMMRTVKEFATPEETLPSEWVVVKT